MFTIEINRKEYPAEQEKNLLSVLQKNGIKIDAPCSGNGKCGKCVVKITEGAAPATETERSLLGEKKLLQGFRLACMTVPHPGMRVETVERDDTQETIESRMHTDSFRPLLRAVSIRLEKPVLGRVIPYDEAVKDALRQQGIETEALSVKLTARLMELVLEKQLEIRAVFMGNTVIDFLKEDQKPITGMAVDIGTTTVAAQFFDMDTGERLFTVSELNRQRAFGADVISRIDLCLREKENLSLLQKTIMEQLNGFVRSFCEKTGRSADTVYGGVIAANTTMLHLLAGIDPGTIANAPFVSGSHFGNFVPAGELGFCGHPNAQLYLIPSVSAYVGGDIVSGLVSCELLSGRQKTALFVDIGTNGEMAILSDGVLTCCSVAAGPAFEGAQIKYGVGGIKGAVSKVRMGADGLKIETIGKEKPVGICGAGLVDALAVMLKTGVVDETGRLCDQEEADPVTAWRIREDEGEFVLDPGSGISVTGEDVRQVQLAKAAIAAGIQTLLNAMKISCEQVEKLYLAGSFGFYLDAENAAEIGLLPKELVGKIELLGNSSCDGAAKILLSSCLDEVERVRKTCRYIELSGDQAFQDAYIENMMFEE